MVKTCLKTICYKNTNVALWSHASMWNVLIIVWKTISFLRRCLTTCFHTSGRCCWSPVVRQHGRPSRRQVRYKTVSWNFLWNNKLIISVLYLLLQSVIYFVLLIIFFFTKIKYRYYAILLYLLLYFRWINCIFAILKTILLIWIFFKLHYTVHTAIL